MSITLAIAQAKLTEYLTSESNVLLGQETRSADGRLLRMADLEQIREGISYWSAKVEALTASGGRNGPRIYGVVPQ